MMMMMMINNDKKKKEKKKLIFANLNAIVNAFFFLSMSKFSIFFSPFLVFSSFLLLFFFFSFSVFLSVKLFLLQFLIFIFFFFLTGENGKELPLTRLRLVAHSQKVSEQQRKQTNKQRKNKYINT